MLKFGSHPATVPYIIQRQNQSTLIFSVKKNTDYDDDDVDDDDIKTTTNL